MTQKDTKFNADLILDAISLSERQSLYLENKRSAGRHPLPAAYLLQTDALSPPVSSNCSTVSFGTDSGVIRRTLSYGQRCIQAYTAF